MVQICWVEPKREKQVLGLAFSFRSHFAPVPTSPLSTVRCSPKDGAKRSWVSERVKTTKRLFSRRERHEASIFEANLRFARKNAMRLPCRLHYVRTR